MVNANALSRTLQAPDAFSVRSVPASGDCFYDSMRLLLADESSDRSEHLRTAGAMRDHVADCIDEDALAIYRIAAQAGQAPWLLHLGLNKPLDAVRAFAKVRGISAGPGKCLWADELAMSTIAKCADICLLIIDEEARSAGSRSGKRRRTEPDEQPVVDSRFVVVGEADRPRCAILHRSRREHLSPVFYGSNLGVIDFAALPPLTQALWTSNNSRLKASAAAAVASRPAV